MVFLNQNKDQIRIVVQVRADFNGGVKYVVSDIMIRPYRKRKEISVSADVRDRYEYRVLNLEGRAEYTKNVFLQYCTQEQIDQAIQEEYARLAPSDSNVEYRCW